MKPTTDEVLAWAFDAGFGGEYWNYAPAFEKLAALAYAAGAKAMQERAAKVCDACDDAGRTPYACAADIRALGDDDE